MINYVGELDLYGLHLRKKYRTSKFLNLNKKYRSHFEIVALMLEAMRDNGATRFSIMKYTSINSAQLKKYLRFLTEMGFIEMDIKASRLLYRASEKGLAYLRQYQVLLGMLLSAYAPDKPITVVYNTSNRQQESVTQIVKHLQPGH